MDGRLSEAPRHQGAAEKIERNPARYAGKRRLRLTTPSNTRTSCRRMASPSPGEWRDAQFDSPPRGPRSTKLFAARGLPVLAQATGANRRGKAGTRANLVAERTGRRTIVSMRARPLRRHPHFTTPTGTPCAYFGSRYCKGQGARYDKSWRWRSAAEQAGQGRMSIRTDSARTLLDDRPHNTGGRLQEFEEEEQGGDDPGIGKRSKRSGLSRSWIRAAIKDEGSFVSVARNEVEQARRPRRLPAAEAGQGLHGIAVTLTLGRPG